MGKRTAVEMYEVAVDVKAVVPGLICSFRTHATAGGDAPPTVGACLSESGQATVEWTGLLLLVCLLAGGMLAVAPVVDGRSFGGFLAHRIACAARGGCHDGDAALARAYGPPTPRWCASTRRGSSTSRASASCRSTTRVAAAAPAPTRPTTATSTPTARDAGERATVFTRLLRRGGRTYIQYWLYYPDSNTTWAGSDGIWERNKLLPLIGKVVRGTGDYPGFHEDDWEGYQVRIDPDGRVWARATLARPLPGLQAGGLPQPLDAARAAGRACRAGATPATSPASVSRPPRPRFSPRCRA